MKELRLLDGDGWGKQDRSCGLLCSETRLNRETRQWAWRNLTPSGEPGKERVIFLVSGDDQGGNSGGNSVYSPRACWYYVCIYI